MSIIDKPIQFCFAIADANTGQIIHCSASTAPLERFADAIANKQYPCMLDPMPENYFYTIIPAEEVKGMNHAKEIREKLKLLDVPDLKKRKKQLDLVDCRFIKREKPAIVNDITGELEE